MAERPHLKLDAAFTKKRFETRVVLVTGGASGIGKACVRRFLNDGAYVAFFDINQEAGRMLETELRAEGLPASFYHVDVSDKDACIKAVNDIASNYDGCINYLVNNAASFLKKGLDATKADWETIMGVNVVGCSNMTQACYPHMKKAPLGNRAIVNVASLSAYRAHPDHWTYNSSKAAVVQLSKCMALDLAKDGIRVNSISPGLINTPALENIMQGDETFRKFFEGLHILNRNGETSEIAAAIAFLCSRDASFITGADIPVDGGYTAMGTGKHGKDGPKFTAYIPD